MMGGMGPEEIQAMLEQGETGLTNFARMIGIYRRALLDNGSTRGEAQELAMALQMTFLKPKAPQPAGPGEPEA